MSAFAYHGVCMMMMTMTIDVWHKVLTCSQWLTNSGKKRHCMLRSQTPFSILPTRRYSNMRTASPRPSQLSSLTCTWSRFKKKRSPSNATKSVPMFLFCLFSARRAPSLFVIPKVGMLKRSGGPRTYALHPIYTLPYLTLTCTFYLGF